MQYINCVPISVFIVAAAKISLFAFLMFTISFAALATGLIFGCFLLAMARNPLEKDALFANAMIGFVLVESFVFTALLVCIIVQFTL